MKQRNGGSIQERESVDQQVHSAQKKPSERPIVMTLNTFQHVSCRKCLLNQQLQSLILTRKEIISEMF